MGHQNAGDGSAVQVRFAGLAGYVLSKAAAAANREMDKDYYDFVYVLLYNNAGGPRAAAEAIRTGPTAEMWTSYERVLRAAVRACCRPDSRGSAAFASEMRSSGSDDEEPVLREDAVGAAAEFSDAPWGIFPP